MIESRQLNHTEGRDHVFLYLDYAAVKVRKRLYVTYSFKIPTEDEQILCEITPGTYEISNVRLAWSSYSEARRWISERNKVNLEDLKVSPDHISGKIQSQSAGILVLSMPYSDGWSCLVDGKEHPTILANHAFLGIELEPGQHEIELTFFPKMLRIGLAVTALTSFLSIAYSMLTRRKPRSRLRIHRAVDVRKDH